MKKALLTLGLLLGLSTSAFSAEYYFSSTGSNTTGAGTQGNPWYKAAGKIDGQNFLNPGDKVFYKYGDEWKLGDAEQVFRSNGVAGNPIIVDAYGTPALGKPLFNPAGNAISNAGWSLVSPGVYRKTMSNGNAFRTIGVDKTHALEQTFTTPTAGQWQQSFGNPNVITVALYDGTSPAGHDIYATNWRTSYLERGTIRTYQIASQASYITFNNLKVIYSGDRGFTSSGRNVEFYNVVAMGCAMDGMHFQKDADEDAQYSRVYDSEISWNVAYGSGTASGQGFTTYSPYTWVIRCLVHDNYMAGVDFLAFPSSPTDASYSGVILSTLYDNGRAKRDPSYDAQVYSDGAHDLLIDSNTFYGGSTQSGVTSARQGIHFGSEHPVTKPAYNCDIINNFGYKIHWSTIGTGNGNTCSWSCVECTNSCTVRPNNITGVKVINNTLLAYDVDNSNMCLTFDSKDTTIANGFIMRNNLFIGDSNKVAFYLSPASYLDSDYNLWYVRTGSTSIISTDGGTTNYTLAQWQAASGEDANSISANPRIVLDGDNSPDAHLQRTSLGQAFTSPAIDAGMNGAYTRPAWVPADILVLLGGSTVVGSTSTDNSLDTGTMDIGFHYPVPPPVGPGTINSANVEPASLIINSSGNVVISGAGANAHGSTGTYEVTFPTDRGSWTFNDGGTTTASYTSGGSGTLSVSVASNVVTLTRAAGSTISAASAWEITLTRVKVPSTTGSTNFYSIKTLDNLNNVVDVNAAVAPDTLLPVPGPTVHAQGSGFSGKGFTIQ